jgi:hypothetical protein
MWAAIGIQTIGAVDPPGQGPRKLPAPGQYVAIFAAWSVLQFMASGTMARGARAASIVFLLVTVVLGPGGNRLIALMGSITTMFGGVSTTAVGNTGTAAGAPASAPVTPTNRYASLIRPVAPTNRYASLIRPVTPNASATVST